MRSKTSLYNKSFGLWLLRRFWPLWAVWLVALLMVGPLRLALLSEGQYYNTLSYVNGVEYMLLDSGREVALGAAIAAVIVAMAMFSYLYDQRGCGMVNALPMTRTTAYLTACLTGLVPMLAAELLCFLVVLGRVAPLGGTLPASALKWLGMTVMSTVGFYGMACFCAVLTGNILVLPAVYAVLNGTAAVVEATVQAILGMLIYGYTHGNGVLGVLSPIVHVRATLRAYQQWTFNGEEEIMTGCTLTGLGYLACFCAVGLLLILLALPVLRRRHMECAGETVAVPVLRPIFRICLSVGCALVGTACLGNWVFENHVSGTALAAAVIVMLCVFAAIGYYAAQMLIRKTLRVFDTGRRQLIVICACLILAALAAEFDLTGYEKRVPDAAEIDSVSISSDRILRQSDSIEACRDFHSRIVGNKAYQEAAVTNDAFYVSLTYYLKDGRMVSRIYPMRCSEEELSDPGSDAARFERLCNVPEAMALRAGAGSEITAKTVRYAEVGLQFFNEDYDAMDSRSVRLSSEQAERLWNEAVLPDAAAGRIGRTWLRYDDNAMREQTTVTLWLELEPTSGSYDSYDPLNYYSITVTEDSTLTLKWIRDELGIEAGNMLELNERARNTGKY